MTEDEIRAYAAALPGVVVETPGPGSEAPEIAWGDSFVSYDPEDQPEARMHPFATVVVKDYPGFDTESRLDRAGVFRLNIAVGRDRYTSLLGHPPAEHERHRTEFDYAVADTLLPHPAYAAQGWVSIVNPGPATEKQARDLLAHAHELAVARWRRRHPARD